MVKRTLVSFYDDQMTHHAAALTYYCLMSLFPALLLAIALLGLLGQYPETYNAIIGYLREVAPPSVLDPLNRSLRRALQSKETAATALAISTVVALYGTTGALEAARRALNVVFEVDGGRSFLHRKAIDIASTFVLMALVLVSLVMVFVGGRLRRGPARLHRPRLDGRGHLEHRPLAGGAAGGHARVRPHLLRHARRAAALLSLAHAGRGRGVLLWLPASLGFSAYVSRVADVGAIYGAFAGAILLVFWLWLTNVALLFGAELNAEIEREKELADGVPHRETLNRPTRGDVAG